MRLHFFYYKLGDKIWGQYGFVDAFNLTNVWFANSYLAIDQGPEIIMIENYRSGLLWNLFMSCPEVKTGMKMLGISKSESELIWLCLIFFLKKGIFTLLLSVTFIYFICAGCEHLEKTESNISSSDRPATATVNRFPTVPCSISFKNKLSNISGILPIRSVASPGKEPIPHRIWK